MENSNTYLEASMNQETDVEYFDDSYKKDVQPLDPDVFDEIWDYMTELKTGKPLFSYKLIEQSYKDNKDLFDQAIEKAVNEEDLTEVSANVADLLLDLYEDYYPSKDWVALSLYQEEELALQNVDSELVETFVKTIPDMMYDSVNNYRDMFGENIAVYLEENVQPYFKDGITPSSLERCAKDLNFEIHKALIQHIYRSCLFQEIDAWLDGQYELAKF